MYKRSIQMGVFTMARPGRTSSPVALTQRGRVLPWRLGPERNRSRAQFRWLPPGPSSQQRRNSLFLSETETIFKNESFLSGIYYHFFRERY